MSKQSEQSTSVRPWCQVLVSIQGLILVDDPMYNEPGFDGRAAHSSTFQTVRS